MVQPPGQLLIVCVRVGGMPNASMGNVLGNMIIAACVEYTHYGGAHIAAPRCTLKHSLTASWPAAEARKAQGLMKRPERRGGLSCRCTPEGLAAAHSGPVPFTRDGVYLVHREAHYSAGPSPLALLWKDAVCSRYVIDTDPAGGWARGAG
jgi:hypothetical protein